MNGILIRTAISVLDEVGILYIESGFLLEGNGVCMIYDIDQDSFDFVCTSSEELGHILETNYMIIEIKEEAYL